MTPRGPDPEFDRDRDRDHERERDAFSREAARRPNGFFREFWLFLRENKKWWLAPMLVILLAFGALVILGGTAVAPFLYTLF